MLPIAHSAHWLVNVAYLLPFVAFVLWLLITTVRERRRLEGKAGEAPEE